MTLDGKTFISTVSTKKSEEIKNILSPLGANVIDFPMIEIVPAELTPRIKYSIEQLNVFHWIIFTSGNGVKHFYSLLNQIKKETKVPLTIKLAVIGTVTARELEKIDRKADFISLGNTSENLVNELLEKEKIQNQNILLPLGNLAPDVLQKKLSIVANVTRIDVYSTVRPETNNLEPLERIKNDKYDLVLFTSTSGVENFMDCLGSYEKKGSIRAAGIGKVTSKAIKQHGLSCILTAKRSTYQGLADEILKYYS